MTLEDSLSTAETMLERALAGLHDGQGDPTEDTLALSTALRLVSEVLDRERRLIPEPEWEPTDDMRAKYREAWRTVNPQAVLDEAFVDMHLRALHREGLL